eukprot:11536678-Alexandrium_andersonii.AAC.1
MSASLVGSEMCIRDSVWAALEGRRAPCGSTASASSSGRRRPRRPRLGPVSYTHLTLPTICSV